MRTLLFSTLYPSEVRPIHGVFVENRLRELLASGAVETRVMAPVPWFPSRHRRWGEYARFAGVAPRETRHGIEVLHPRYPLIPKVGMTIAPALLALACVGPLRRLIAGGFDFDLIDAHYFYPDGVAAAWLARRFGKPLVITARGSDVNLIGEYALARRQMRWAAGRAGACIGVSQALADRMAALGVPADKLLVLRNGVDLERFRPLDRSDARRRIGLDASPLLLSVGNLIPLKGHDLCIEALAALLPEHPGAALAIVGAGPLAPALRAQ
ncbi:MAG: glycosyltransferase, partial [Burkholderiales bacterium]|nr:glycosyltransferase [Burkholderiales bacterium]